MQYFDIVLFCIDFVFIRCAMASIETGKGSGEFSDRYKLYECFAKKTQFHLCAIDFSFQEILRSKSWVIEKIMKTPTIDLRLFWDIVPFDRSILIWMLLLTLLTAHVSNVLIILDSNQFLHIRGTNLKLKQKKNAKNCLCQQIPLTIPSNTHWADWYNEKKNKKIRLWWADWDLN